MKPKTFEKLLKDQLQRVEQALAAKGQEYSTGQDRLHNFKRAGELQRVTQEQALLGMWSKHLVSIIDMVEIPGKTYELSAIDEKFTDAINYLILLKACIYEREFPVTQI